MNKFVVFNDLRICFVLFCFFLIKTMTLKVLTFYNNKIAIQVSMTHNCIVIVVLELTVQKGPLFLWFSIFTVVFTAICHIQIHKHPMVSLSLSLYHTHTHTHTHTFGHNHVQYETIAAPVSKCACQLPEHPNAMATASGDSVRLFSEERRREERRGFPRSFPGRHVVLLLSCHEDTPHTSPLLTSTDAQAENRSFQPPPPGLSVTLHHLDVNFSPGCHLPTQSSISLSVCLAGTINGLSLEQVLILLQWTRQGPSDWNTLLHQYPLANFWGGFVLLSIQSRLLLVKPSRMAVMLR